MSTKGTKQTKQPEAGEQTQDRDDQEKKTQDRDRDDAAKEKKEKKQKQRKSKNPDSPRAKTAPASPRGRVNKIYRTPATPPPDELLEKERGFVLDSGAVSNISSDYSKANPKLGPVIPPYNAHKDDHVTNYFRFHGVDRTLSRTGQIAPGTSIEGPVNDYFQHQGAAFQYVYLRNQSGAGHSREITDGHGQFMQDTKPVFGFNGAYGFRRNTPWLRQMPSPFGVVQTDRSPTHMTSGPFYVERL